MRADRLLSLVLLLRHHGKLSASRLAAELEVSTRTVVRDIQALSIAGVPVYAEPGRGGGYALLPGFRTELTGLNHDETIALQVAAARRTAHQFGLGPALAAAMLKIADALPEQHRQLARDAERRVLIDPPTDLLARRVDDDPVDPMVMAIIRQAVLAGTKVRLEYVTAAGSRSWRTVDPVGVVTVRDHSYLLAIKDGADRTYRLSRVLAATELQQPADRPDSVDLDALWRQRSERFRAGEQQLDVVVRILPSRREFLAGTVIGIALEHEDPDGWRRLQVSFQDERHAVWALSQLGMDAEAVTPPSLRHALHQRAVAIADRYAQPAVEQVPATRQ